MNDIMALLQAARLQTQANRYAFLRQASNKKIVRNVINQVSNFRLR